MLSSFRRKLQKINIFLCNDYEDPTGYIYYFIHKGKNVIEKWCYLFMKHELTEINSCLYWRAVMRLQKFGIKCIKGYSFPKLIWCRGIRHILTTFVGEKNNEEQRVLIPRVFFKAQLGEKQVENHCFSTLQINSKLHLCSLFFLLTA